MPQLPFKNFRTKIFTSSRSKATINDKPPDNILLNMKRLWNTHASLIRQVTLSITSDDPNQITPINCLLLNQKDLGIDLGQYYGWKCSDRYRQLLTVCIDIILRIIAYILYQQDITEYMFELYLSLDSICNFMCETIKGLDSYEMKRLLYTYIETTVEEIKFIVDKQYLRSNLHYNVCMEQSQKIATYIAIHINKNNNP